jgi:nicotinamide mononucleotide transporter
MTNLTRKMKTKVLNAYDWFLIAGIIAANLVYSILSQTVDVLGTVTAVSGVLCVVLVAKGSILNYFFGLINVSLYAYVSFKATAYGDAALNALYYLPMQFIGYFAWKRRVEDTQVKARRLTMKQRMLVAMGCAAAVVAVGFVLQACGAGQPFKDSATTVLSIVAQILMAMAFMEQWVLWIMTNVISVVMWVIFAIQGEPHAGMMVIMWVFYLLNSVNGLRVWLKLSDAEAGRN